MKIKSLLAGMLASAAFVACTNDVETVENNQGFQAGEKAYVAVNILTQGSSRATGDFEDGLPAESQVSKAVFLFLDGDYNGCANPFEVTSFNWETSNATGVTQEATTLVIDGIKDEVPAYIVAILNPTSDMNFTASTSLSNLKDIFKNFSSEGFVMSNAVYAAGNDKEVVATPIKVENIAKTKEGLSSVDPVQIQVERVVAKVAVDNLTEAIGTLNTTGLKETIDDQESLKLKFVLTGWEVLQNQESRLIKNIDATNWDITGWNAESLKRSYWANDYTTKGRTSYQVTALTGKDDEFKYVEETVNQKAHTLASLQYSGVSPYLLVSGYFVDASDESETPAGVNLVEWYGQKYTEEGYLNLVAGMEKVSQYYTYNGKTTNEKGEEVDEYVSFSAELLKMQPTGTNDWGASAVLKDETTQFYTVTFKADGKTIDKATAVTVAEGEENPVVAAIAEFGEVQYWNGGNAYYFVPIKHQEATAAVAATDNTPEVPATNFYGVVRNHVYKMNISKITGYGTPVADPTKVIDEPEKPTEGDTYMQAEVLILDWRIVENDVELN